MSSSITSFLIVAGVVVGLILLIRFVIKFQKNMWIKVDTQYGKFAETFGLTVLPGKEGFFGTFPQINGTIDSLTGHVYSYKTGGKNKVTYTVMKVILPTSVPDFSIMKQGFIQKVAKKLGGQDILIGNQTLDETYVFKCKDENTLIKIVDEDIQQMLLALKDELQTGIHMKGNTLSYSFLNHIIDDAKREKVEKVYVLLLKLAKNIQSVQA